MPQTQIIWLGEESVQVLPKSKLHALAITLSAAISVAVLSIAGTAFAAGATAPTKTATEEKRPVQILFTNVNIFDGFSDNLQKGMSVLVEANYIKEVGKNIRKPADAHVVGGEGRTMTPGLIDMHQHIIFNTPEGTNTFTYEHDFGAAGAIAAQAIRDEMLMKGITTIHDIAGNTRWIANAIQRGLLIGPRIYTSGGVLSHTGGHGDWGAKNDVEPNDYGVLTQHSNIVDGRENVGLGARRVQKTITKDVEFY